MQPEVPVPMRSQVGDFLAAHGGIVHSADVGPLIGYAAWLIECRAIDEQVPAGWHEALSAALADVGTTGTMPDSRFALAWAGSMETPPVPPGVARLRRAGLPSAAH
ncbi:MAG: hypothetical protein OEX23_01810 [Betaproteobacteria bacterium]|jgi:hypothetical protein|nr:hypothetical protein [Betaproteobacteria bacterium]